MRRAIAAVLDALLLFWTLAIGPFCWLLRDGLGPDAVDSHGTYASPDSSHLLLGAGPRGARGFASTRAETRSRPPGSRGRWVISSGTGRGSESRTNSALTPYDQQQSSLVL